MYTVLYVHNLPMLSPASLLNHISTTSQPQSPVAHVRFVAVSATVPNMQDIADWLDVPPHGVFRFGDELRPCPLTVHV